MNPAIPALAVVALAGAALLWLFISASFLLWGARLAGVERRSYGRAFATLLLGGIASALLTAVLSAAPLVGTGLGLLLGFCVSSVVMMAIFDTTFGKALAANILAWVLPFVLAGVLALIGFALFGVLVALA
ncbi:MAG: hypothetical protein EOM72_09925 [Opitutae bacterium]|nr:hypothetical protein [Opitutae bacterium]